MAKLVYRKYPAFVRTLKRRHEMYNGQLELAERLAREGSAFLIRPSAPLEIGRLESDPEKVQQVYDLGRADAEAAMEKLKAWLEQEQI